MRILIADQNALLLAAIAATFGRHCEIVTAPRRDVCLEHVEQRHFDLVVACEKLAANYTGLELLSEIEAVSPATLRIFAARPETLKRLGSRLDFFGLLGTLHYPIEARKLLIALKVARGKLPGRPTPPKVKHVVLESEWDTGERLALLGQEIEDAPTVVHEAATPGKTPEARDRGTVRASTARHETATHRNAEAMRATAAAESPATEEPAPEFWATPPAAIESAAVERGRHIAEALSFDVSFEVSFDENPSRFDITGHGSADTHASTPAYADGYSADSLEVSFDETPYEFVAPSDEPFKESLSPGISAAATAPGPEENPPYVDLGAANDEMFSEDTDASKARCKSPDGKTSATATNGTSGATSAVGHRATARDAHSAPARETPSHSAGSPAAQQVPAEAPASAAAQRASANASASTPQAGPPNAAAGKNPASAAATSKSVAAKPTSPKSAPPKQAAAKAPPAKGPRPRQPTVPTAAQREAFQRALARRNAARAGGAIEAPPMIDFSSMEPRSATRPGKKPAESGSSLSDLARMATTKRPLPGMQRGSQPERSEGNPAKRHRRDAGQPERSEGNPAKRHRQPERSGGNPTKRHRRDVGRDVGQPKRRAFVVGSGIAAVLLVAVVSFELLHASPSGEHTRHGRGAGNAQLFSATSTLVAENGSPPPQIFSPPPPRPVTPTHASTSGGHQPQTFDPDTAPPDPPPPPALERPGPMEPPSMAHNGPPVGMQGEPITE